MGCTLAVKAASSDAIIKAGSERIGRAKAQFPYLPTTSPLLSRRPINYVQSLKHHPRITQSDRDSIADYILLSASSHVLTGWRYIAQAATAFLNGSRDEAIHLSYYAELRAAMAILGESGIFIGNSNHCSLDSRGTPKWFSGSTHQVSWLALSEWTKEPYAQNKLMASLSFNSFSVRSWAKIFGNSSTPSAAIIENWIKNWSVDLLRLHHDRERRNLASYRPNLEERAFSVTTEADIKFICDISRCFEIGTDHFESIDAAIIFDLAKKTHQSILGPFGKRRRKAFWSETKNRLETIEGLSSSEARLLVERIKSAEHSAGYRFVRFAQAHRADARSVLCRALFLLRLASAILRLQWVEIQTYHAMNGLATPLQWRNDLLYQFSRSSNIWFDDTSAPVGNDYSLLAVDYQDALDDVESWLSKNPFDRERIFDQLSRPLNTLSRLERIGVIAVSGEHFPK